MVFKHHHTTLDITEAIQRSVINIRKRIAGHQAGIYSASSDYEPFTCRCIITANLLELKMQ